MPTAIRPRKTGPAIGPSKSRPPRYEPVLELPPLPFEQYTALKTNIAVHGVLLPILTDGDGPLRRIIDGSHRKRIADELGYECPEIRKVGLTDQEMRTLARALNLARRQLDQQQKRQIVADQLQETPGRSNRWIGKQLGVSHPTVAAVRQQMESTGKIFQCATRLGADNRTQPAHKPTTVGAGDARFQPSSLIVEARPFSRDYVPEDDAILRAAAVIRSRRLSERWESLQEGRRQSAPAPRGLGRGESPVLLGDCLDILPTLEDGSVGLVVTSPPYAEQRAGLYAGVPEAEYPRFTVGWMEALWPKLREDGSVFIVIRPHLRNGVLSDYLLRTRLALREFGWNECEELIWMKPNPAPVGSKLRPRRAWESILWYSRSPQPYTDLKACGRPSNQIGFGYEDGTARVTDVIVAAVGVDDTDREHPAVFPLALAEQLIMTFSQEGDLVLDPFSGSGQTLLAAKGRGRRYVGIEREGRFVKTALERLER